MMAFCLGAAYYFLLLFLNVFRDHAIFKRWDSACWKIDNAHAFANPNDLSFFRERHKGIDYLFFSDANAIIKHIIKLFFLALPAIFLTWFGVEQSSISLTMFGIACSGNCYFGLTLPNYMLFPINALWWTASYLVALFYKRAFISYLIFVATVPAIIYHANVIGGYYLPDPRTWEKGIGTPYQHFAFQKKQKKLMYFVLFLCVISVILPFIIFPANNTVPKDREYQVTYTARMIKNDHVGDSWSKGLEHEGLYIRSGSVVVDDNKLTVTVYAEEKDSSTDYDESSVTFKNLDVGESETKKVYVYVTEDRGRYAGNTATWLFTITVQRIR